MFKKGSVLGIAACLMLGTVPASYAADELSGVRPERN